MAGQWNIKCARKGNLMNVALASDWASVYNAH